MASLLTDTEKASFIKGLDDLFDTFKQNIVIYKEAKINIVDINRPRVFGYNSRSDIDNISYETVTGVFPALVNFNKFQKADGLEQVGNLIPEGTVNIKIKSDAKDFISDNGATIGIGINGLMFKITSFESPRRYISPDYYSYTLERQK